MTDTGTMRVLVLAVGIAVLVSLLVVVLAAAVSPESDGLRAFFRDLRAGLSARFGSRRAEPVEEVEPVDTSLEDLFATTATQEDPYFTADGLAHRLESVVSRARR